MSAVKVILKKPCSNGESYKIGDTVTLDEADAKRLVALGGGEIISAPFVAEDQEELPEAGDTTVSGVPLKDLLSHDYDYEKAGVTEPEQGQSGEEEPAITQHGTTLEEDKKPLVIKPEKELSRMLKPQLIEYALELGLDVTEENTSNQIREKILSLRSVEANA